MSCSVCIIAAGYKPIPPTLGGAVETIVQNMIDINEEEKMLQLTICSVMNKEAQEKSKKYKYSKFIFFDGSETFDKVYYWVIYKVFKKVLNISLPDYLLRSKMIRYAAKHQSEFDWIILQAGELDCIKFYSGLVEKRKLIYHSHGEVRNKKKLEDCFGYYIAVSDFIKDVWLEGVREDRKDMGITLLNGVNQDKFLNRINPEVRMNHRIELGFSKEDIVLTFVGRIIPEKGVLELLKALEFTPSYIKLLMVGSSSFGKNTKTNYEKQVSEYVNKLGKRVVFSGYIPNEKIGEIYRLGDISVVPSMFNDPAPLVIIESMAAGLPIITTGSGGITEYCDEKCSIVVERGQKFEERLAMSIRNLAENKELRVDMGINGKRRAQRFTDKSQYIDLTSILDNLL